MSLRAIARYPSALRVLRFTEVSPVVHHSDTKPEDINLAGQNIRISKICKLCCAGCEWAAEGGGRGDVHYTGCNNGGRKHWQSGSNVATAVTVQGA